jgi:hypothetical protein
MALRELPAHLHEEIYPALGLELLSRRENVELLEYREMPEPFAYPCQLAIPIYAVKP